MKAVKIITKPDGKSAFEDFDIEIKDAGDIGKLSETYPVKGIIFRETSENYDYDWHNAPAKQFILMLDGAVDITTGEGETRRFGTGDILLVEDTEGQGHISRAVDGKKRKSVFVILEEKMKAVWSDTLASGNETMDNQHKQLFDHINTFFDGIEREFGHEMTVRTLNFLVKYVRYHFGTEEELMRATDYPELHEHKNAHRIIVDQLMDCYKKLIADGNSEYIIQELSTLLQEWFVSHIMGHDVKLASYLKDYDFE